MVFKDLLLSRPLKLSTLLIKVATILSENLDEFLKKIKIAISLICKK